MAFSGKRAAFILFVGDVALFVFSLWASLALRTLELPTLDFFMVHLVPFSLLFALWVGVFFIAGLYESRTIVLARRSLSATLLWAQNINIVLAALFFFLLPVFGLAPKTILIIYLFISYLAVLCWRAFIFPRLGIQKKEIAIAIGASPEVHELIAKLTDAARGPAHVAAYIDPTLPNAKKSVIEVLEMYRPKFIIVDFSVKESKDVLPPLQPLLASGVRFYDAMSLYEEVFGRVPLCVVDERWIARYASSYSHAYYDSLKRAMDILIALPAFVVSLCVYPVLSLLIKLQDGGPIFYRQVRNGQHNTPFTMYKFRSMSGTDQGDEVLKSRHVVTPLGVVLRKTRLDEIPQLWGVIRGEMSLIGPRPEFPAIVHEYEMAIPYYAFRHMVKPGLSGWAQLYHDNHPHHGTAVEATKEKLSFDLYYLKHRSAMLDLIIALKTVKKLITRSGV